MPRTKSFFADLVNITGIEEIARWNGLGKYRRTAINAGEKTM